MPESNKKRIKIWRKQRSYPQSGGAGLTRRPRAKFEPTGADIVAALANSPLAGLNFARLSIRAKVRSELRDMDDWF